MTPENVDKILDAANKMLAAACLQAEIEAMKAENQERELRGEAPAHGYKQFMNAMERWSSET